MMVWMLALSLFVSPGIRMSIIWYSLFYYSYDMYGVKLQRTASFGEKRANVCPLNRVEFGLQLHRDEGLYAIEIKPVNRVLIIAL